MTAPHTLINLGEPKPGFKQLSDLILGAGVQVRSYVNGDSQGHDLVTDVPFSLPLQEYQHIVPLAGVSESPPPDDAWLFFRYHHAQLYLAAILKAVIGDFLPGISDLDIADLIVGIYSYPGDVSIAWDHFDDGTDSDQICWGLKYLNGADVIIFRGSTTEEDWIRDFDCVAAPFGDSKLGPVHPGFLLGLRHVAEELAPLRRDVPLIVGGHSLGAGRAAVFTGILCS